MGRAEERAERDEDAGGLLAVPVHLQDEALQDVPVAALGLDLAIAQGVRNPDPDVVDVAGSLGLEEQRRLPGRHDDPVLVAARPVPTRVAATRTVPEAGKVAQAAPVQAVASQVAHPGTKAVSFLSVVEEVVGF